MKKLTLFYLVICLVFSCTKNSVTTPSINIANLPKSYIRYFASDHKISYRVYTYDSNDNLAGIALRTNDTINGTVSC